MIGLRILLLPQKNKLPIVIVAVAILLRIFALNIDLMYYADVNTFKSWATMLYENGLSNFYISESFTDYPPGYMYVLYVVGWLSSFLNFAANSNEFTLLIKMPSIICDILICLFIYNKVKDKKKAFILAFVYAINPAVILNSAVWGQVDSVYTLITIISIYLLTEKKYLPAFLLFSADILMKPQALIFAPIFIMGAFSVFKEDAVKMQKYCVICIVALILLCLPFTKGFDFIPIVSQYVSTIASYPYASLNAYNFYALIGGNWVPVSEKLVFIPYSLFGMLCIIAIALSSFYLLYKKTNAFIVAAFLNTLTFMFSVKMHERYLYPTLAFLLLAYAYNKQKKFLFLFFGFSATLFLNCYDVLIMLKNGNNLMYLTKTLPTASFVNLLLTVYMVYLIFGCLQKSRGSI